MAEYLLKYENMDAKTFELVFTDPSAIQPPQAYRETNTVPAPAEEEEDGE